MGVRRATSALVADHIGQSPKHGGQVLSSSGANARSTALDPGTYRLSATEPVWYKVGDSTVTAAVATAGCAYLGADAIDYVTIDDDDDNYLAVIAVSAAAKVSVTQNRAR